MLVTLMTSLWAVSIWACSENYLTEKMSTASFLWRSPLTQKLSIKNFLVYNPVNNFYVMSSVNLTRQHDIIHSWFITMDLNMSVCKVINEHIGDKLNGCSEEICIT
jgi:hypothetical protein